MAQTGPLTETRTHASSRNHDSERHRSRVREGAGTRERCESAHTLLAEGQLDRELEDQQVAVEAHKVLRVRNLQAGGAARQADLANEAVLLDQADRVLIDTALAAKLLLETDERPGALADDCDVLKVARRVAADEARVHHLRVRHGC